MKLPRAIRLSFATWIVGSCALAHADLQQEVGDLQHRWAAIYYQAPASEQPAAFDKLAAAAARVSAANPGHAEPLVWQAIILSSDAKATGGLGALSEVKQARQLLLDAEKIDPASMGGSIYCSLGSLYAKVPGWPIAFGDKSKAADYFNKALAINPDSIDAHFLYADLLADEGDYAGAVTHLQKALAAAPRPDRADADAGRRQEAQRLLETLRKKYGEKITSL